MTKGSSHQEVTFLNVYASNERASKYMKQKMLELQGELDDFTTLVRDFNTPSSTLR